MQRRTPKKRPQLWIHDDYDAKAKKYTDDVLVNPEMFPDLKVKVDLNHCPLSPRKERTCVRVWWGSSL